MDLKCCVCSPGLDFLDLQSSTLESCFWIPGFGCLGWNSWVWIPALALLVWIVGLDFLQFDSCGWLTRLGILRLDSWAWRPRVWSGGFRLLQLDSWNWIRGLNLLPEFIFWPQLTELEPCLVMLDFAPLWTAWVCLLLLCETRFCTSLFHFIWFCIARCPIVSYCLALLWSALSGVTLHYFNLLGFEDYPSVTLTRWVFWLLCF